MTIDCPHCGQKTLLGRAPAAGDKNASDAPAGSAGSTPGAAVADEADAFPAARSSRGLGLPLAILLLAGAAGAWWWFQRGSHPEKPPPKAAATAAGKMAALAASESNAPPPEPVVERSNRPKSPDDLKTGPVTLEKAKSGSLVHAVGTVRNDSDHQRFGVRVEIGLTDAKGQSLRNATDYTAVIEPHKEWRFRALVLDAKATTARVISVKEDL